MLWAWADRIIVMQPVFKSLIFPQYWGKVVVYDVGPDVWGNCLHLDLIEKLNRMLDRTNYL